MRNAGGYAYAIDYGGNVCDETDTFSCIHCNAIVPVKPKQRPEDLGGWCRMCAKPICPKCADKGSCDHFEKKLARIEASQGARRSYGIA